MINQPQRRQDTRNSTYSEGSNTWLCRYDFLDFRSKTLRQALDATIAATLPGYPGDVPAGGVV